MMFIVSEPSYFGKWPMLVAMAKFAATGGLIAFGIVAKDHDVTAEWCQNPITTVRHPLSRMSSIYQFWLNGSEIVNDEGVGRTFE